MRYYIKQKSVPLQHFCPNRHSQRSEIIIQTNTIHEKNFNCSVCLFKEKFIGYVDSCDGIRVIDIETGKGYYITGKYDYVDAIYTVDNETFCLCTKDLHDIFGFFGGRGLSQQYKLDEDEFEQIGKNTLTGVCNCFMTDSENNFVMGTMSGRLLKFTLK